MKKLLLTTAAIIASSLLLAQNVGIGTSTPSQKLDIIGNVRSSNLSGIGNRFVLADPTGTLTIGLPNNLGSPAWLTTGNDGIIATSDFLGTINNADLRIRTNNIERIAVKNSGFIGLYTNVPSSYLHAIPPTLITNFHFMWDNNLSGDAPARFQNTLATNGNRCFLGVTNYNTTGFIATATMGLALNNTVTATLAGAEGVRGYNNSTSGIGVYAGYTGGTLVTSIGWALYANGWAGGLSPWLNVSDGRLKKNVVQINNALDKVMQLRGVEYNFNSQSYPELKLSDKELKLGFVAQEVEKVFPQLVVEKGIPYNPGEMNADLSAKGGSYTLKTVAYSDLIPVLVEAIKEQQKQIEDLKHEITKLKNANNK